MTNAQQLALHRAQANLALAAPFIQAARHDYVLAGRSVPALLAMFDMIVDVAAKHRNVEPYDRIAVSDVMGA